MTSVTGVLVLAIQIYLLILLVRVVFSFVSPFPTNPVSRFAWQMTEPVLAPIRRVLPATAGLDLSPLVVFFGGYVLIALLSSLP